MSDWQFKQQSQGLDHIRDGLTDWMRLRLDDASLVVDGLRAPAGTGVANETVMFDTHRGDGTTEGYVVRLATPDSLYLDFDLRTHYRMYETMTAYPAVPTPDVVGYEADAAVVGAPFFVMERVEGAIPTDRPSWATEGFVVDAAPAQRRALWERTVAAMVELHKLDAAPFAFLRTGATGSGTGDCLDYWSRSLRWAHPGEPLPLTEHAEEWLVANQPEVTALAWGDSRLPNVIYRDFTPVALLDWDLVSLAGPQSDLAWWIIMQPEEAPLLEGIGSHNELVDLWEELTGTRATELRWYLVLAAYRLAAILAKLFSMSVAQGHMSPDVAEHQLMTGHHVQLLSGLLELPADGITPRLPEVTLDR